MPLPGPRPLQRLERRLFHPLTSGCELDERAARNIFLDPPRGTIADRWQIYASGYFDRLSEALENDYPALRRIVGSDPFGSLVRRYALAVPPRSFDLGQAGDRLSEFLATDWLAEKLPFLPDLARLEWGLAQAFVSEDAVPLRWDELRAMDPESVSEMPLLPMPGTVLLRSRWPLIEIWKCKDRSDPEVSVEVEGRPSIVLVYRSGFEARCTGVSEVVASLLDAADEGGSLASVQERLAPDGEPAAIQEILQAFRRMIGEGVFRQPDAMSVVSNHKGEME